MFFEGIIDFFGYLGKMILRVDFTVLDYSNPSAVFLQQQKMEGF